MREAQYPKTLTVSLSLEQYRWLKDRSDSRRISIAELLREIVENYSKGNNPNRNN